jgi:hypothetical protein
MQPPADPYAGMGPICVFIEIYIPVDGWMDGWIDR